MRKALSYKCSTIKIDSHSKSIKTDLQNYRIVILLVKKVVPRPKLEDSCCPLVLTPNFVPISTVWLCIKLSKTMLTNWGLTRVCVRQPLQIIYIVQSTYYDFFQEIQDFKRVELTFFGLTCPVERWPHWTALHKAACLSNKVTCLSCEVPPECVTRDLNPAPHWRHRAIAITFPVDSVIARWCILARLS